MPLRLDAARPDFAKAFAALLAAKRESASNVDAVVAAIIEDVRRRGDAAVLEYTERFDRQKLTPATMRIGEAKIAAAMTSCPKPTLAALKLAAKRIETYHRRQMPKDFSFRDGAGLRLGARWTAIA
ncbi:MAG TPA: histidinol dehydrogenase, partial [Alphaproteobacteria bacterium]|nr:histidinol dehydrogenase [Alphaproteobacteria bacterium]